MAGGIGDYGSDESDEEDAHSARGSESSDTDDEELRHRIREKQDAFRRKEREMQLLQEKQAHEAQLARGKKFSSRFIYVLSTFIVIELVIFVLMALKTQEKTIHVYCVVIYFRFDARNALLKLSFYFSFHLF